MSAGIDYGLGRSNVDVQTGIRYGVICVNGDLLQAWADTSEADYGDATCPKCGNAAVDYSNVDEDKNPTEEYEHGPGCADWCCHACQYVFDAFEAYPDEALGYGVDDGEYEAHSAFDGSCAFITKSPYFTHARYCSPCAPGAGDLDNPDVDGARTYCFGHDWFEDCVAPYPVYRVDTGELVKINEGE
jgi:rubredoxin